MIQNRSVLPSSLHEMTDQPDTLAVFAQNHCSAVAAQDLAQFISATFIDVPVALHSAWTHRSTHPESRTQIAEMTQAGVSYAS